LSFVGESLLFNVLGLIMSQLPPIRPRAARRRKEAAVPGWGVAGLIGLFVVATALTAYLVFTGVRDFVAGWQITGGGGGPGLSGQNGAGGDPASGGSAGPVQPGGLPQKWTGTDRVTILLLGIDRRAGDVDTRAFRSDTLMILSVDPVAQTAVMLSIPRDLWVDIPGFGNAKITEANFKGDAFEYPGGGAALAVKTVENNLGVDINYFVRIDFTAFETFIDAIGGISVDNPEVIDDPDYPDGNYGYDPFYLAAGTQTLNGRDALRYARTRHNSSDVDRAKRQQQVVIAVREKVLSGDGFLKLLTQAPALYQKLNESVYTDLSLDQMVSLALLVKDVPRENITQAVLDYRYVIEGEVPGDPPQSVLIPNGDEIRSLIRELFPFSAPLSPAGNPDDPALVKAEAARVEVLNGAGRPGLAGDTETWLTAQGVVAVVSVGNANRADYAGSVIVTYTSKPYTVRWLQKQFNVATILRSTEANGAVDVQLILGQDWQVPGTP
jgi:LCP family protein required for cell wall assembly